MANSDKKEGKAIQNNYSPFLPWQHGQQKCSAFFVREDLIDGVAGITPDRSRKGQSKEVDIYEGEGVVLKREDSAYFIDDSLKKASVPLEPKYTTGVSYLCPAACFAGGQAFQVYQKNVLRMRNEGLNTPLPLAFTMDKNQILVLEEIARGSEVSLWRKENIERYMKEISLLGKNESFESVPRDRKVEICHKLMDRNLQMMQDIATAPIEFWQQLVQSYTVMTKNRVYIDAQGENVFFHKLVGFPIIDYDTFNLDPPTDIPVKEQVDQSLARLLNSFSDFSGFFTKNGGGDYRVNEFCKFFNRAKERLVFAMKYREKIEPTFVKRIAPHTFEPIK